MPWCVVIGGLNWRKKIRSIGWDGTSCRSRRSSEGWGYKDLHSFNMDMLAKQAWRLLLDPGSLCARVTKAKYYRDLSLLEAQPKDGIYYTCHSILRGKEPLKEGVIRRWEMEKL